MTNILDYICISPIGCTPRYVIPGLMRSQSYEEPYESHQSEVLFNDVNEFIESNNQQQLVPVKKKINKKRVLSPNSSETKLNKKDYRKNICRNILRHAIKSMLSNQVCRQYLQ